MKKNLFSFLLLFIASISFSQSIPNGGFESWTNTTFENPQFYGTSNTEKKDNATYPPNAVKTTDAFHGSYAIKLNTVPTTGTNTAFAYFANGNPGGSSSSGLPYAQKPSGIRFYYKCNIIGTDSALFLCFFKKAGVYIGQYLYKFPVSKTNYTLFNTNFSPALTQNPDTIIVAAASSNAFASGGYQAGNYFQIDSINFKGVASQPAGLNGDFENWVSLSSYNLNGWNTDPHTVSQSTDAYSGSYALELQSMGPGFGDSQPHPGRAMVGTPTSSNTIGGTPFSNQVDTFVFYYKYLPADPNDSARFSASFKKNGVYFSGFSNLYGISASYKKVTVPINLSMAPDSMILSFESSKWPFQNSFIGSDFKVDNFYLTSQRMPISNFIAPSSGCVGQPIQLTDYSSNMANAWGWIMPGGNPGSSTAQNPVVTYYSTGTKTITMVSNNAFGAGTPIAKTITIYAVPNVASTSTVTACGGGNVILTASGATTYTWNTGANTTTIGVNPTSTTLYTVTGTSNGCEATAIGAVIVPATPKPDICMVTVDSLNKFNEIYWDKSSYPNLDSMIIYREVITNTYKRIGAVSKNALSMWVDTARSIGPANGDPSISTYRYKIQIRDTCGSYGPKSNWHNTVYFTHTGGTFFWPNNYMIEGPVNPVQTYSLMVCINPSVSSVYTPVGTTTGNQSSLTDNFYSIYQNTADWRVEADLGYVCTPTARYGNGNSIALKATKTRSNIQNNRMIGINEVQFKNRFRVYPNPATTTLNLETAYAGEEIDVVLTNVLGQVVYSSKMNKGTYAKSIDVSSFAKGVYTLTVNSVNGKAAYKVIVE